MGERPSQMAGGMNRMVKVTEPARGRRWTIARPPHRVEALEIERGGQQVPFGRHLAAASEQEAPGAVPLLEQAKDRLDDRTTAAVQLLGRYGRHQLPVPLQYRLVFADLYGAAALGGGARAEGRTGSAVPAVGPVTPDPVAVAVGRPVRVCEHFSLRTQVGIGLRAVGEVVFMVGVAAAAIVGRGHQHRVAGRGARGEVVPRMVPGVRNGHHVVRGTAVRRGSLDQRCQMGMVVGVGGHVHRRDQPAAGARVRRRKWGDHRLGVVAGDEATRAGLEQGRVRVGQVRVARPLRSRDAGQRRAHPPTQGPGVGKLLGQARLHRVVTSGVLGLQFRDRLLGTGQQTLQPHGVVGMLHGGIGRDPGNRSTAWTARSTRPALTAVRTVRRSSVRIRSRCAL